MKLLIALIPRVKELINEMKSIIKNPEKSGRIIFLLVISSLLIYATYIGTLFLAKFFPIPFFPLNSIFTMLFALILFSGAIISINEFFVSNDLNIFLSSPLKSFYFYFGKIVITIFSASWMPIALLIPCLIAFGVYYNQGALYYLMMPIVIIPILSIPIFLGNIFVFLFSKLIPIKIFKEVLFFFYITVFLLMGVIIKNLFIIKYENFNTIPPNAMPYHKVSYILNDLLLNKGLLINNISYLYILTLLLLLISYYIFKKSYFETLNIISSYSSAKTIVIKKLESFSEYITSFLGITRQQIFFKEYKTFLRNLGQASQIFLLLGIVFLYFSNLSVVAKISNFDDNPLIITIVNLAVCSFILIAFCSRFIYPSLSLESKAYDIFLKSPINLKLLYNSKKTFWLFFLSIISLVIFISTSFVLNFTPKLILLSFICALVLPYGLINVSLFTGSYFLKLNWKNPYELCSSIGSLSCMLLSMLYLCLSALFVCKLYQYMNFENYNLKVMSILVLFIIFNILIARFLTFLSIRKLKKKILL